jgi:EAL domain-containing protein (putative c-di-GMP-specific phosphodiesterase class I)
VTHPLDVIKDTESANQLLTSECYQIEKRYIRKDKSICYALLSGSCVRRDGAIAYFVSQVQDLTRYKALENTVEKLRRSHLTPELKKEIEHALHRNEFELHYQPIINLQTMAIAGNEALIRWQHPTKGLLYPNTFVDVCEEDLDLQLKICKWVFQQGCRDMGSLKGFLSVNVSPKSLLHKDFMYMLEDYIMTGSQPILYLEITERLMLDGENERTLGIIADMGFGIFIDDFGQGYSGLIQLLQLFVAINNRKALKVKLDIWFVRNLDKVIVFKMVSILVKIMRDMAIEVIAEGIENETQLKLCRELGVNYGQGWYWGRAKAI